MAHRFKQTKILIHLIAIMFYGSKVIYKQKHKNTFLVVSVSTSVGYSKNCIYHYRSLKTNFVQLLSENKVYIFSKIVNQYLSFTHFREANFSGEEAV